jgi:hypothetical protein
MLSWKTLLLAAPIAASLLAANNAHAEWGGHDRGEHEHFDRGGFDGHRDFDRRFEHHDFDDRFFFFRDGRYYRR